MSLVLPQFMLSGRREQLEVESNELLDCTPILGRRHSISVPTIPEGSLLRNHYPPAPTFQCPTFPEHAPNDGYFFEREGYQPTKRRKSLCNGNETEQYIIHPHYPGEGVTHVMRRGSMPSFAHQTVPPPHPVFRGHPMSRNSSSRLHPRTYRDAPLSSPLCQPNLSAKDYQQQMLQYERSHYSQTADSTDTEFLSELESLELEVFAEDSLHDSQKGLSPGFTPTDGNFLHTPTRGTLSDSQGSPTAPYFYDESLQVPEEHFSPHVSPPYPVVQPPPTQHLPLQDDFSSPGKYPPPTVKVDAPPPSIAHFPLARTRVEYPPTQVVLTNTSRPEKERRKGLKWTNVTDSVTSKYSNPNQPRTRRKGRTSKPRTNQSSDPSEETLPNNPTVSLEQALGEFDELDTWSYT